MERASEFRSLRAPQQDGQKLIDPPWPALPDVVARNRQHLGEVEYDLQGRSLAALTASARRALIQCAAEYSGQYRDVPQSMRHGESLADKPLVLSGHQPQLFHPGVWYKNFVLGGLAGRLDGIGIHLLIDSDLCRSASVRVPTGSIEKPRVEAVPYDAPAAELPYEERAIRDHDTLATFAQRVVTLLEPLVREPLVKSLWPLVLERNAPQTNLGLRLAQGRHALEASWGQHTLELPQSAVCQLPEFAWFVAHILAQLPRFWLAHNDALEAYRQAHRMRNRAQPVPDLAESDGWLEAPFWIWSSDDPQRRALFVRQSADQTLITDRHHRTIRLPLAGDSDAGPAVEQLLELASGGVKIRTRALTTTLFARLLLSDLFLHGIGGAKYDQVTDQIAQQFFGFALPEFAAVSATLRLPIRHPRLPVQRESELLRQMREMRYHPERFTNINGPTPHDQRGNVAEIIETKRRWVQTAKTPQNARQRHMAIAGANEALQPYLAELQRQAERQRDEFAQRKRASAVLESREYSFCVYPRRHFEQLLLDDPPLLS